MNRRRPRVECRYMNPLKKDTPYLNALIFNAEYMRARVDVRGPYAKYVYFFQRGGHCPYIMDIKKKYIYILYTTQYFKI